MINKIDIENVLNKGLGDRYKEWDFFALKIPKIIIDGTTASKVSVVGFDLGKAIPGFISPIILESDTDIFKNCQEDGLLYNNVKDLENNSILIEFNGDYYKVFLGKWNITVSSTTKFYDIMDANSNRISILLNGYTKSELDKIIDLDTIPLSVIGFNVIPTDTEYPCPSYREIKYKE